MSIPPNSSPIFFHFESEFKGRVKELKTKGSFLNPENEKQIDGMFLWDTGATVSCINSKAVSLLGLSFKGITRIYTANGAVNVSRYIACIILTDTQEHITRSFSYKTLVTSVELKGDILGLIGMDIIGKGSFLVHYNEVKDKHTLQFSVPGLEGLNNFDFKNEAEKQNKKSI